MEILYVIGNGFDLWHGLPTKHTDFYAFSTRHLDELEQFLHLDTSTTNLWNNFEADLGKFDWEIFYSSHNFIDVSDDSFKPSMAYSLEDDLREQADNLVDDLKSQFQEWIESIPIEDAEAKFNFRSTGRFISFNYTPLLQMVYGIADDVVFHIHGSASKYDPIIFGHGESMEEEPELDENGDSNRTMFTDAEGSAKYPFYAFQKPVDEIIEDNRSFFESLKDVEVVAVIGHSLNDIDIPYFKSISNVTQGSKWVVSQYSENEGKSHLQQLRKCGVAQDQIKLCSVDDVPKVLASMQSS